MSDNEITFKIDYLSITIWGTHDEILEIHDDFLSEFVGDPIHVGHGHRGYQWWGRALSGVNVYSIPVNENQDHGHIELKGEACEVIPMEALRKLIIYLQERHQNTGQKFNVTRLDLAWDGVNASPLEFLEAVQKDYIRSLAKRDKWKLDQSPLKEGEEVRVSTTVYFGAPSSARRLRVYDRRGFTRVELQTRDKRAHAIVESLFVELPEQWGNLAISHLRDYLDVYQDEDKETLAGWWAELVGAVVRANMTVTDAKQVELYRLQKWIVHQVAPALSVIADTVGESSIEAFIEFGRVKRGDRYKPILENIHPEEPIREGQGELIHATI